jgi:hypothetical protein
MECLVGFDDDQFQNVEVIKKDHGKFYLTFNDTHRHRDFF